MTPEKRARRVDIGANECVCVEEGVSFCAHSDIADAIRVAVAEERKACAKIAGTFQDRGTVGILKTCGCGKLIAAAILARKEEE